MKLHVFKFALAGGILWAVIMFITTLLSVWTGGYASDFLWMMASIYPGYEVTLGGSIVGLIYGFIDAFVLVLVFGWLYNLFCGCKSCGCETEK